MKSQFVLILCLSWLTAATQTTKTAPLTTIVEMVSNSLNEVDQQNNTNIELTSVTASFAMSKTISSGFSLNIWIFKLGRKAERNDLRKVTLSLTKGDVTRSLKNSKSSSELTNFINAALKDFQQLNAGGLLAELNEREITLEIGLTITKETNAGGEYTIGIFTLGAEGGKRKDQGHTLTLTFKRK